jgi:myo-inositol-1(or 4)-monophosphatase
VPSPDITVQFASQAIEAVRAVAVEEILPRYRSVAASRKADGSAVTEADLASQRALARRLARIEAIPVMGEEMPASHHSGIWERGGRFWCVDPLDGTSNFAAGIPFFALSVALMEGTRPVFGTVYDPIADEAFYAVRGAGAWLDHRPLRVPAAGPPLSAAIAEVSLRRDTASLRGAVKSHPPFAKRLTSGSSALSWCHLAAARVEEAGGFAATLEHDDFWAAPAWSRSVIAARTAPLLDEWRAWIRASIAGA